METSTETTLPQPAPEPDISARANKAWEITAQQLPKLLPQNQSLGKDRDGTDINLESINNRAHDPKFKELLLKQYYQAFKASADTISQWSPEALNILKTAPAEISTSPEFTAAQNTALTSLKAALEKTVAEYDAYHAQENDPLMGILSRREFFRRYHEFLETHLRHPTPPTELSVDRRNQKSPEPVTYFAVVMMDVDGLKAINTAFGHPYADTVLAHIGSQFTHLRPGELAGRYGGDEIALLLPFSGDINYHTIDPIINGLRKRPSVEEIKPGSIDAVPTLSAGSELVSTVMLPALYLKVNNTNEITPEGIAELGLYLLNEADKRNTVAKESKNTLVTANGTYH